MGPPIKVPTVFLSIGSTRKHWLFSLRNNLWETVRGPLDVLKETWYSGEVRTQTVIEWIEELGKRLKAIRDVVEVREMRK